MRDKQIDTNYDFNGNTVKNISAPETDLDAVNRASLKYTHTQGLASASWVVVHNLNKLEPNIIVRDTAGDYIEGFDYVPINSNSGTLVYPASFGGIATFS